jgi:hypothetical protein
MLFKLFLDIKNVSGEDTWMVNTLEVLDLELSSIPESCDITVKLLFKFELFVS